MREKTLDKGYFTIANNTDAVDYVRLAYATALSIKLTQPTINKVSIATTTPELIKSFNIPKVFDDVIEYTGPINMEARSRAFIFTPFKETVFIDSDLLFLSPVDHWWEYMSKHEMFITTRPTTFRGKDMKSHAYRKVFDVNNLPDFYSGFMYFKECRETAKFFKVVEALTDHPETWKKYLKEYSFTSIPTDEVCALASKLLDNIEDISDPKLPFPRFTHMKGQLQGLGAGNWTDTLPFYYDNNFNINLGPYAQTNILHYTIKDLITDDFIEVLERNVVCQTPNIL